MKTLIFIFLLIVISCKPKHTPIVASNAVKPAVVAETTEIRPKINRPEYHFPKDSIFSEIANYPTIKDTAKFISELIYKFDLEIDSDDPIGKGEITAFKKLKIYGSNKSFFLVEYDWKDGCMAAYPWKNQLIFDEKGKIITTLYCERFEMVQVFPGKNPCLLTLFETAKGNGGHQLYKITADTLENIYEGYYDYAIRTYDAHRDCCVYEPNELNLKIQDNNKDGFNDLIFYGKMLFIMGRSKTGKWYDNAIINGDTIKYSLENPFDTVDIKLIFEYNSQSGHFKAKEDYVKRYGMD